MKDTSLFAVMWATIYDAATKNYGLTPRQAEVYCFCCMARATWKDWERLEH